MRIWHPIPPLCLDRQRLLGEHRELHAVWSILSRDRVGYRHHPEVERWEGHLEALRERHRHIVEEARRRGWPMGTDHATPIEELDEHPADIVTEGRAPWPDPWEPVDIMRAKLAAKQDGPR